MVLSIFLAKVLSVIFIISGLAVLLKMRDLKEMVRHFLDNKTAVFFTAFLELILGSMLVISHNTWVSDWRIVITLLGWLMVIESAFYLLTPYKPLVKVISKFNTKSWYIFGGIISIVVGLYLGYFGFLL